MSWRLLDRPKTQKVTRTLAKQFAEMEPAPHDRPLSERRLQVYHRLLAEGQFRPVTWASALCKETEDVYRVNGKHTSTLLAGLEKVPEFFVTIEEYEADTLEDVAKLYATFDRVCRAAAPIDIYLSFASTVEELKDIPPHLIKLAVPSLAYEKWGQDSYSKTPAERAELVFDDAAAVLWIAGIMARDDGRKFVPDAAKLRRQPVVAAMFTTMRKSMKAATEFWSAVRDETGPQPTCADRKLAKYLLTTGTIVSSGSSSRNPRKKVIKSNNREIFVKCLHAWNAWRKNETTNLNYHADAKVPAIH